MKEEMCLSKIILESKIYRILIVLALQCAIAVLVSVTLFGKAVDYGMKREYSEIYPVLLTILLIILIICFLKCQCKDSN